LRVIENKEIFMNITAFIPQLGMPELLIILVVALLLFGGKKLPGLSRALGRSLSEFKRGKKEGEKTISEMTKDTEEVAEKADDTDVDATEDKKDEDVA
jgi:sec-independent protein translocase protein TatA